jgi:hypothetical protein
MNKLLYLFMLLVVTGCSKNPVEPLPPICNHTPTFEQHLESLRTPGHTYFWMREFALYDLSGQLGWNWTERGMPDLAYSLACSLWETMNKGYNVGVCGQFAAMYVVAAREHAYDSGFLITYHWDADSNNVSGHARGWIIYEGCVYVSDNTALYCSKSPTKEALFDDFAKQWFSNPHGYGWITDNKLNVIYDMNGRYDIPKDLTLLEDADREMIFKSISSTEEK